VGQRPPTRIAENEFFPLAKGNQWKYRCSVEGKRQFEKTLAIVSLVTKDGRTYYKAERRTTGAPLILYFFQDEKGFVREGLDPNPQPSKVVATATMSIGDSLGELRVTRHETLKTPATGEIRAIVAENFNPHESPVSADRMLEWRGVFYAQGIGPVVEADGLGGDCTLVEYRVK
jgi:hypothetical protein